MPASVSFSTMMTRVRELADMQTSNEAQAFVTDAELKRALNRNLKQLYQKLIIARGDDYYATRYTTALVANQAEYAFGLFVPDFMQLLGIDITDGTRVVPMPKFILKEYADLKYLENLNTNDLGMFRYRLNKQGIEIRPMPRTANYSLTLHYLPAFTELVNAGDTFDGVNGWEDWACYGAAIDLLNKEESFEQAAALQAMRGTIDGQIDALAGARDAGRPEFVGDVMRDWNDLGVYYRRNDWRW